MDPSEPVSSAADCSRHGLFRYLTAEESADYLTAGHRLGLSGRTQAAPWDEGLSAAMTAADVAVHEDLTVDVFLSDLQ